MQVEQRWEVRYKINPGTQVLYSGEGFEYLAKAVAYLKDIPLNDLDLLFKKELAEPLGIKYVFFTWNDYVATHQAAGYC